MNRMLGNSVTGTATLMFTLAATLPRVSTGLLSGGAMSCTRARTIIPAFRNVGVVYVYSYGECSLFRVSSSLCLFIINCICFSFS